MRSRNYRHRLIGTQRQTSSTKKAIALERGGADLLIMATNTMHKVADKILGGVSIPFVHIADATATAILDSGFRRPGLMGNRFHDGTEFLHRSPDRPEDCHQ